VNPERGALGDALHRLPAGIRHGVPRSLRDQVRRRVGPFAPWESGFDHRRPPEPIAGEEPGPPDFVGIGAQKAGTTWWFAQIVAHPGVHHPASIHKERHYFAPFALEDFGPAEIDGYHAWFPRPAGTLTGEWTPDYMCQPWVPELLAQAAPDTRLLVILRDPVERLVSGVAHSGVGASTHVGAVAMEAVTRSLYEQALRRWLARSDPSRMLVLQYERLVAEPTVQLRRTYEFLGLDASFVPPELAVPVSVTRTDVHLGARARGRLVELLRPDVAALSELVPDLDLALWPNFRGGVE